MSPAEMHTVGGGQFLAHDNPRAVPLTLILVCQFRRDLTTHTFADDANRGLAREFIHYPDLCGVLSRNILIAKLYSKRCRKYRAILRTKHYWNAVRAR